MRNKCSNISWGSREEEKRTNSVKLQKTMSSSRCGTTNLTSSTRLFIMFLTQYITSHVKAWSWLRPLQTAYCSNVEKNQFCQMERFLRRVFYFPFFRLVVLQLWVFLKQGSNLTNFSSAYSMPIDFSLWSISERLAGSSTAYQMSKNWPAVPFYDILSDKILCKNLSKIVQKIPKIWIDRYTII